MRERPVPVLAAILAAALLLIPAARPAQAQQYQAAALSQDFAMKKKTKRPKAKKVEYMRAAPYR
jgi:hypothetical protein